MADTNAETTSTHFGAHFFCKELKKRYRGKRPLKILVAGCGSGHEAFFIHEKTGAEVHSIDVEDFLKVSPEKREQIHFQVGSVCDLPFEENTFDAVFYYHVIEHVIVDGDDRSQESLQEIGRVTRNDGWVFIGTPNRSRLLSSLGAHRQSEWNPTIWNKIFDNLRDWKDRLVGRFHNRFGAHAGFTTGELNEMTSRVFGRREWVTQKYIRQKYADHRLNFFINWMTMFPFCFVTAPSIYVWCRNSK